jgi:hypothetical protein
MKLWIGVTYALFVIALGAASSQQNSTVTSASEQLHFSAKDHVQKAVKIPNEVLLDLKKDKLVKAMASQGNTDDVSSLLSGSTIHLNSPDEQDLVVVGRGGLVDTFIGTTVFWIYRPSRTGYEMIFTTYGGELTVNDSRTKGYRDLVAVTPNSTLDGPRIHQVQYQFDGKQYLAASETR